MRWHEKVSNWHHFRLLVIESSTRPNRRGLTETEAEEGFWKAFGAARKRPVASPEATKPDCSKA